MSAKEFLEIADTPDIEGLRFRRFRGSEDLPLMHVLAQKEKEAIEDDFAESLEDFQLNYRHLVNCDPSKDLLIAEIDGEAIAYCRAWWMRKQQGGYNYNHFVCSLPEWWGKGVRDSMIQWCEERLADTAKYHDDNETKAFQTWALSTEDDWIATVERHGYEKVRYGFTMLRSLDVPIPDLPLPEGIEVRPVEEPDYRTVWEADVEAFKDGWEPVEMSEEFYHIWREKAEFQPEKWQVAWSQDKVAGAVQNFINKEENAEHGRLRGYTENIHVGREWRGQGLAKALIARSFKVIKQLGMEEACLGVDAENPTGALRLYESMGFEVDKTFFTYRKPVPR